MRRRRGGMKPFTAGAISLVILGVLIYLGFTKAIPFQSHYDINAAFKSTNNIKPNSPVRIAGVQVGKVTGVDKIDGDGGEGAVVKLRIDDRGLPIHKDATATIRPRIFLEGNFFVELQPGSPAAPELEDGDTIPIQQTSTPVQLDQILTALQRDTREELQVLLREYGKALEGEGADGYRRAIKYFEPANRDNAIVADALRGQNEHDLSGFTASFAAVAEALDSNPGQLKALITDFRITAAALAREQASLQRAIAELPRTLRAASPALAALNASFPPLRRLVADLRPAVRSTGPMIDATLPLVRELRGAVQESELRGLARDLRPTVAALGKFNRGIVPLNRQARLLASCQNEVVTPWSRDKVGDPVFPATEDVYHELSKVLPGLAGESRSGDANGQWFRVLVAGGTNLVNFGGIGNAITALPINGTNPPKTKRPQLRPDVPCETQQPPDLRSRPGAAPAQRRVSLVGEAAQKRAARARERALAFARRSLRLGKQTKLLRVSENNATLELLQRIAGVRKSNAAAKSARIREANGG